MSSPQTGSPDSSFQNRLNRVAEKRAPIEAAKPEVAVLPDWKESIKHPSAIVGAALVGMLAVFVARYARYHLMGGSLAGDDADITMMIDGAIGVACSFVLFSALRFKGAEYKAAQTFGIFAMIMIMHNFVHAAPRVFNTVFSPQWTQEVIAMTEPNSILFRGATFVLYEEKVSAEAASEEEAPALPKVRRMGG